MSVENLHGKSHDHWATPEWLMAAFIDWDDPCPMNGEFTGPADNGLLKEWEYRSFVNPPYSNSEPWVDKAINEAKLGKRVIMLLKVDPSTRWWLKLVEAGAHFAWFISDGINSGRLAFSGANKAAFPSVLVFLEAVEPSAQRSAP